MLLFHFESLFHVSPRKRWAFIVVTFLLIAGFDFATPSEFVPAYLYAFPILVSVSFLRPRIAKILLALAIVATLLNLVFPRVMVDTPSVLFNRILSALSILISAFFMLRYIQYQKQIQTQERLLETERNLGKVREDLIATLTHDLKTPLLGEQKTLQYLLDESFGTLSDEQKEVLGVLQRSNNRQLSLLETLLSVYRNDNMGVDVQPEAVNMDELIADILTELQYIARERSLTLNYSCQKVPPLIRGEALQLKRVLSNLIHNALNYTPCGGYIAVSLVHNKEHLRVEVQDSGPGLSPDDLENVFHRFYRAGGDRQVIGTGLGLYLSRQIIQAHQGRIWAENSTAGCRFIFTLPIPAEGFAA